jgi:pyruvate kinase
MDTIIRHVEASDLARYWRTDVKLHTGAAQRVQNVVSLSGTRAAEEVSAKAIVIYTTSGKTAYLVSDYRPKVPIIAFVPNLSEQRRLCFAWGVQTEILDQAHDAESLVNNINDRLQTHWHIVPEDVVVLLTKIPLHPSQRTNSVHIHTVTRRQIK